MCVCAFVAGGCGCGTGILPRFISQLNIMQHLQVQECFQFQVFYDFVCFLGGWFVAFNPAGLGGGWLGASKYLSGLCVRQANTLLVACDGVI